MGHLAKRRYDLESGGPGPLGLEVPAIMVAGAAKEGIMLGSDLSKMLQGHVACCLRTIGGSAPWDIMLPNLICHSSQTPFMTM